MRYQGKLYKPDGSTSLRLPTGDVLNVFHAHVQFFCVVRRSKESPGHNELMAPEQLRESSDIMPADVCKKLGLPKGSCIAGGYARIVGRKPRMSEWLSFATKLYALPDPRETAL